MKTYDPALQVDEGIAVHLIKIVLYTHIYDYKKSLRQWFHCCIKPSQTSWVVVRTRRRPILQTFMTPHRKCAFRKWNVKKQQRENKGQLVIHINKVCQGANFKANYPFFHSSEKKSWRRVPEIWAIWSSRQKEAWFFKLFVKN